MVFAFLNMEVNMVVPDLNGNAKSVIIYSVCFHNILSFSAFHNLNHKSDSLGLSTSRNSSY